jgi:hypothetical protein
VTWIHVGGRRGSEEGEAELDLLAEELADAAVRTSTRD